jgi:hypothetical protein
LIERNLAGLSALESVAVLVGKKVDFTATEQIICKFWAVTGG